MMDVEIKYRTSFDVWVHSLRPVWREAALSTGKQSWACALKDYSSTLNFKSKVRASRPKRARPPTLIHAYPTDSLAYAWAYRTPMATLLTKQKPCDVAPIARPSLPAWCPGGRIAQKALRHSCLRTRSTDSHTTPERAKGDVSSPSITRRIVRRERGRCFTCSMARCLHRVGGKKCFQVALGHDR